MNKRERLEGIKELIVRYPIDTQDEIVERLQEMGFHATQATVSRDMKELNIRKIPTEHHGYIYGLPKAQAMAKKQRNVLACSSMGKMVNIDLVPGSAVVVKRQLLELFKEHIFSVIADDDSVLLVVKEEAVVPSIEEVVKGW